MGPLQKPEVEVTCTDLDRWGTACVWFSSWGTKNGLCQKLRDGKWTFSSPGISSCPTGCCSSSCRRCPWHTRLSSTQLPLTAPTRARLEAPRRWSPRFVFFLSQFAASFSIPWQMPEVFATIHTFPIGVNYYTMKLNICIWWNLAFFRARGVWTPTGDFIESERQSTEQNNFSRNKKGKKL